MRQIFITIFAIVCSFGWAEAIRIEPAKRQCVILLPEKANFGLKFAAEELSYHVIMKLTILDFHLALGTSMQALLLTALANLAPRCFLVLLASRAFAIEELFACSAI